MVELSRTVVLKNRPSTEYLSGHCLLVRFAWAIFRRLEQFGNFEGKFRAKNRIYREVDESPETYPETRFISIAATSRRKFIYIYIYISERRCSNIFSGSAAILWRVLIRAVCPGLHEVHDPSEPDPKLQDFYHKIVVYPDHRRIERIKEKVLEDRDMALHL